MTTITQKRDGNAIRFYRGGSLNEEVAVLYDGHAAVIFDPMVDHTALFLGGDVIDQAYFDGIGLTVDAARQLDALRVLDISPESAH